jgi:TolB-like protein/thioredoxin-like negative regulator of GroEL
MPRLALACREIVGKVPGKPPDFLLKRTMTSDGDGAAKSRTAAVGFDPASGELRVGNRRTSLRPRTAAVMGALFGAPGELQTKERLLQAAWPDCIVTEESLTQCLKEIRKALGPAAARIRTIPRRGYIFLPEAANPPRTRVGVVGALAAAALTLGILLALVFWRSNVFPVPPLSSVLVLPFTAAPGVPGWLADGLSDTLIDELARLPKVKVIARGTSDSFRGHNIAGAEAGRVLGVAYVVEGHVRPAGGATEVEVRLYDTRAGYQHWSELITAPRLELAAAQRQVAARVARTLEVELVEADLAVFGKGRSPIPRSQELTLQGWASLNRGSRDEVLRARSLFQQAVATEARDSRAWLGLSHTFITSHILRWPGSETGKDLREAAESLARAQSLEPEQLYVRGTEGVLRALQGRIAEARLLLESEVAKYPSNATAQYWLGIVLIHLNEGRAAEDALRRAIELSPRDKAISGIRRGLAMALIYQGRTHEAVDEARRSVAAVQPHRLSYATLAVSLQLQGQGREAAEAMAEFLRRNPAYTLQKLLREELTQDPAFLERRKPMYDAMLAAGLPQR